MATRMQQRRGTAAEWTTANPVLASGEIGYETDTNKFKFGDGVTAWSSLEYFTSASDLLDGAPEALNTLNELAAALNDDENFAANIATQIALRAYMTKDTAENWAANNDTVLDGLFAYDTTNGKTKLGNGGSTFSQLSYLATELFVTNSIEDATGETSSLQTQIDTIAGDLGVVSSTVSSHVTDISNINTSISEILIDVNTLNSDVLTISGDVSTLQTGKADISGPEFTGTVVLPATTSIGSVTSAEIEHLSGVTSAIQTQIDAKLESSLAATTYAPINNPTLTGTVGLPNTTSIGDISSTEISYLDGVSSNIQDQLNDKAPTNSPTFTGTVSGITASMVGLSQVDNTADLDKPISTATQTALDAKLSLSGGTMTGKITLDSDPIQALHAATKQYVDNVATGILAKPAVLAATTSNLSATYNNGASGVGATLTSTSNGAFPLIDGVALTTLAGQRGILVKNQTNAAENGRYNLTTQGDENTPWVLTRCGLCDEPNEIPGAYIFVTDGTTNGQTAWVLHVDDPVTFVVGTDDIDAFQFAGSTNITAGTNIEVSGNQVSVVDAPTFAGTVDVSAAGIEFADGVQTKLGVPSLSTFTEKTSSYTLDDLSLRDNIVEMNSSSALTFTIPTDASLNWPVGASMDIFQTGSGQVTIAPASGSVTVNGTPGLKLRTQWSSATILKRGANSWIVYGDLTA